MKPVQIPSFMSIGTTFIELREFKEKKKKKKKKNNNNNNNNNMDKMGKICLALIGRGSGILVKYFIHSFVLTYTVYSSEVELT